MKVWFRVVCICLTFLHLFTVHSFAKKNDGTNNLIYPSLEIMLGEMILVGFHGETLKNDAVVLQNLRDRKLGGVILFERTAYTKLPHNIRTPEQTKKLIVQLRDAAPQKIFIAVDQEGGAVQRLSKRTGFSDWPSAKTLGALSVSETYASSLAMNTMLADIGFTLNFAPVVDLHDSKSMVIGRLGRAFSAEPKTVIAHATGFVRGAHDAGIIPVLKHFPGHGMALLDSHESVVDASSTWTEKELLPYKTLIKDTFQGMIMTAHINLKQFDVLPATFSSKLIDGLLRKELGWDGVVISDDLQMKAISVQYTLEESVYLALQAGIDILLFGNNLAYDEGIVTRVHNILRDLVQTGRLSEERIRTSWRRIHTLKRTLQ